MTQLSADLKSAIRDVPDFPKKGILFKDITTLLARGELFREAVDRIADHFQSRKIEKVAGIESRGFIFAAPVAYKLNAGVVPIRKKGKLPYKTISVSYELEYGTDSLEIHEDAVKSSRVLVVDDLLATGGTAKATAELVQKAGGSLVGIAFLIELGFLKGREKLKDYDVFNLITF